MHANLVTELFLLLALAAAGLALFERLRLPSIAGFLVVGAVAGPGGLGLVGEPERVRTLAELGVVFLLFEIGLELPLERLKRLWRAALIGGSLQVGLTVTAVAFGARALGVQGPEAWVLGALVAMSSTALVMRLLAERGQIDSPHGQLVLAILLFQDFCILPFLLAVPLLAGDAAQSPWLVLGTIGRAVAAAGLLIVGFRYVVPVLLDRAARLRSPDLFSLLAIALVVGSAVVAEEIGLTLAVGAFLAGVVTGSSPYSAQLFAEVGPVRGVLLGLFFTAVGMLFAPAEAVAHAGAVLAYVGAAVGAKALLIALIVAFGLRRGLRLGVMSGLALAQTGEFSFVLAAAAGGAGILSDDRTQVFVAGSVLSLLATPFLMNQAPRLANALTRFDPPVPDPLPETAGELSDHTVLIGFGLAGRTLARILTALERPYVGVDANAHVRQNAASIGQQVLYGDATRTAVLEHLGVARARLVVVTISDPVGTRHVVSAVRALAPEVVIVARTRYVLEVDALEAAGADLVVAEELESTIDVLSRVLQIHSVPEDAVHRFAAALREEGYEPIRAASSFGLDPWLLEVLSERATQWVTVPDEFPSAVSIGALDVRARSGVNVLAVERDGAQTVNPPPQFAIRARDRLLVLGDASAVARLQELLAEAAGPGSPS
ncbi:MAG: cation:proton antiporter [Proteobacteria bacterium]|nr:cation:proton antiporter [Pseudomonadota bacterium]